MTQLDQNNLNFEVNEFKANTANVMDIMVNSLYEDTKKIVLRELISNSSDAIKKFCDIHGGYDEDKQPSIKLWYNQDKEENTYQFCIEDNGIGMSREDLKDRIGVIAKSGTKEFKIQDTKSKEELIGQFGVGFYSTFAISDSVTIYTRQLDSDKVLVWKYNKNDPSNFIIKEDDNLNLIENNHGTKIILDINEKSRKIYFNDSKVEEMIIDRSEFVKYPVYYLFKSDEKKEGEWKRLSKEAIWLNKKEITPAEHKQFYLKSIKWNRENSVTGLPYIYKRFDIENPNLGYTLKGYLAIPNKVSFNYGESGYKGGIRTFQNGVHVTDNNDNLIPNHLKYVIGMIDSPEFALNISRDNIQTTNKEHIKSMRKDVIKIVFDMIKELKKKSDDLKKKHNNGDILTEDEITEMSKYDKFYEKYHAHLKMSFHDEMSSEKEDGKRESSRIKRAIELFGLLKFRTSKDRYITVKEYVDDMKEDQKCIYYLSGFKSEEAKKSPFISKLIKYDYEVLFLEDMSDEYLKNFLVEFKNGKLVDTHNNDKSKEPDMNDLETKIFIDAERDTNLYLNCADDDRLITDEEGKLLCEKLMKVYEKNNIFKFFKILIDESIDGITASIRNQVHLSAQMEKNLMNQTAGERKNQFQPVLDRKNLLINPSDKITRKLYDMLNVKDESIIYNPKVVELCKYVKEIALLTAGYDLDKPQEFAKISHKLLSSSIDDY